MPFSKSTVIWMHCASLGEFEQGRPVLEGLRKKYANAKIVLTFFSPSGYEVRRNWDGADIVCYLPMDGVRNARDFIRIIRPSLVIFVKYEFWYYYLTTLQKQNIPTLLISAGFRRGQVFFKWYGGLFRRLLRSFNYLLVQDEASKILVSEIMPDKQQVLVAGDTRYDRVSAIAASARLLPQIEKFKAGAKLLIAGSTWPEDEKLLQSVLPCLPPDWKLILAPHEIDAAHLRQITTLFGDQSVRYSEWGHLPPGAAKKVLVIDNIGMLSSLYRYGEIAFVGGGFNRSGIHNILEPAVFGLPVLFGPFYQKFVEAHEMVAAGLAFPVTDATALRVQLQLLWQNDHYKSLQPAIRDYIAAHTGATDRILNLITKEGGLS